MNFILRPFRERISSTPAWWLFALLAGGLPLFVWPWAADSFVLAKESAFQCGLAVLAAAMAWMAARGDAVRIALSPATAVLAVLVGWKFASALWAESRDLALDEALRFAGYAAFFLAAQSLLARDRRRILAIAGVVWAGSLIVAVWALALDARGALVPDAANVARRLGDWRDFVSAAAFGNTGHIADFLACGMLIGFGVLALARGRALRVAVTLGLWVQAAAMIVCWSVHSNLSLVVGAGMLALMLRGRPSLLAISRNRRRYAVLGAGWLIVVLFFVVDHPLNPHGSAAWSRQPAGHGVAREADADRPTSGGIFTQAFASPRWKEGGDTRLAIWKTALDIVRRHAVLGVGAGNFTYEFPSASARALADDSRFAPYAGSWTNAAHNEPLQEWAETGIVGLALLALFVGCILQRVTARFDEDSPGNRVVLAIATAILAAMVVQSQMSFPLRLPASTMLFLLVAAIPEALPVRGSATPDILMPVKREFGFLGVQVMMKNMERPVEAGFALELPKPAAIAVGAVAFAGAVLLVAGPLSRPLRADCIYRPAREALMARAAGAPRSPDTLGEVEGTLRRALDVWPAHVDVRSALSELLVRGGKFEEALAELKLVHRRLDSIEVHVRAAISLQGLGRTADASAEWRTAFDRRPDLGSAYPREYRAYLASHSTTIAPPDADGSHAGEPASP